jgi:hypothetical protein
MAKMQASAKHHGHWQLGALLEPWPATWQLLLLLLLLLLLQHKTRLMQEDRNNQADASMKDLLGTSITVVTRLAQTLLRGPRPVGGRMSWRPWLATAQHPRALGVAQLHPVKRALDVAQGTLMQEQC